MIDVADRLAALEMRVAEQDRVVEDLNATATAQWNLLEALRRDLARLLERIADAESRLPGEPDQPPPHY